MPTGGDFNAHRWRLQNTQVEQAYISRIPCFVEHVEHLPIAAQQQEHLEVQLVDVLLQQKVLPEQCTEADTKDSQHTDHRERKLETVSIQTRLCVGITRGYRKHTCHTRERQACATGPFRCVH